MKTYLDIVQIILGIALIILILFEVRSSGLGGVFGGAQTSLIRKRRGVELLIFRLTIATSILFFITAVVNVLIVS
jgi:protein translocase SecG subunit